MFYSHVGQNSKSLIELTPTAVKAVFNDDSFQFQSTLTIDNLISFLKGTENLFYQVTKAHSSNLMNFQNDNPENIQNR